MQADLSHIFSALPARVDLRKECAPLYDQGELGSCTAHAIARIRRVVTAAMMCMYLTRARVCVCACVS